MKRKDRLASRIIAITIAVFIVFVGVVLSQASKIVFKEKEY